MTVTYSPAHDLVAHDLAVLTGWDGAAVTAEAFARAGRVSVAVARGALREAVAAGYVARRPSPSGRGRPVYAPVIRSCRECGCTETNACAGGCWWAEFDLCTRCTAAVEERGTPADSLTLDDLADLAFGPLPAPALLTCPECLTSVRPGDDREDSDGRTWHAQCYLERTS